MEYLQTLKLWPNKVVSDLQKACLSASAGEAKQITKSESIIRVILTCPLSGCTFSDPVYCFSDGITYERGAIECWGGSGRSISPVTGRRVESWGWVTNRAVKSLVDAARTGHIEEGEEGRGGQKSEGVGEEEELSVVEKGKGPKRKRAGSWEGMWNNFMKFMR